MKENWPLLLITPVLVGIALRQIIRRRGVSRARSGELECAFRVVSGSQVGLSVKWMHGVAILRGDRVSFAGTVGGIAPLKRDAIDMRITEIVDSEGRRPGLKESFRVSANTRILLVRTETANLEWAMLPDGVAWAIGRVGEEPGV